MGDGTNPDSPKAGAEYYMKVGFWMMSWYLTSMCTLFMNKIILTSPGGDKYVLGVTQMCMTATLGAVKVYGFGGRTRQTEMSPEYNTFTRDMFLVGIMRGATVILGLVSLAHVAVSFTETVKSSAPLFTVLFSYLILGERTPWQVVVALIPVMFGLAVSSATEISFDTIGFFAAIGNNIVDCVQNVFSKKLLNALTPVQLQFYTSCAAAAIQLPMILYTVGPQLMGKGEVVDRAMLRMLLLDGLSYHLQSVTAYYTMSLLSPVSQSVSNTLKRALLIVLSIMYFQNEVGLYNVLGVSIVIFGVFLYNHCRRLYG
mmetsp:Transcript_8405/g.21440  ORF Transcript_8405/g.21440 Transcript_8405/m.21440 type:complete len:314 (+) Transcript_8405:195-1136(+)